MSCGSTSREPDGAEYTNRLNSAYTYGTTTLLQTIKQVTGLSVNHVIATTFTQFENAINTLGCVYDTIDERYYHNNAAGGDQYQNVDLQPGYQCLNGSEAEQFVSYRHTDTSQIRDARDQSFLLAVKQQYGPSWPATSASSRRCSARRSRPTRGCAAQTEILNLANLLISAEGLRVRQVPFQTDPCDGHVPVRGSHRHPAADPGQRPQLPVRRRGHPDRAGRGDRPQDQRPRRTRAPAADRRRSPPTSPPSRPRQPGFSSPPSSRRSRTWREARSRSPRSARRCVQACIRNYLIHAPDGDAYPIYVEVFSNGDLGQFYDVQGTTWTGAPLFADPNQTHPRRRADVRPLLRRQPPGDDRVARVRRRLLGPQHADRRGRQRRAAGDRRADGADRRRSQRADARDPQSLLGPDRPAPDGGDTAARVCRPSRWSGHARAAAARPARGVPQLEAAASPARPRERRGSAGRRSWRPSWRPRRPATGRWSRRGRRLRDPPASRRTVRRCGTRPVQALQIMPTVDSGRGRTRARPRCRGRVPRARLERARTEDTSRDRNQCRPHPSRCSTPVNCPMPPTTSPSTSRATTFTSSGSATWGPQRRPLRGSLHARRRRARRGGWRTILKAQHPLVAPIDAATAQAIGSAPRLSRRDPLTYMPRRYPSAPNYCSTARRCRRRSPPGRGRSPRSSPRTGR